MGAKHSSELHGEGGGGKEENWHPTIAGTNWLTNGCIPTLPLTKGQYFLVLYTK